MSLGEPGHACIPCVRLTESDLRDRPFMLIKETDTFIELELELGASGLVPDFDVSCTSVIPPIIMTMDAAEGHMATDNCHPTCGLLQRCSLAFSQGSKHHYNCSCRFRDCIDVGVVVSKDSFETQQKVIEICGMTITSLTQAQCVSCE